MADFNFGVKFLWFIGNVRNNVSANSSLKFFQGFRNEDETPLLYVSCQEGQTGVVRLLLRRGFVDLEPRGLVHSPLWAAARNGRREVAEILIDSGANVNHRNPLHAAVIGGRCFETVKLLVERGADFDARDSIPRRV